MSWQAFEDREMDAKTSGTHLKIEKWMPRVLGVHFSTCECPKMIIDRHSKNWELTFILTNIN